MTPVRLEPVAPRSRVKHSNTRVVSRVGGFSDIFIHIYVVLDHSFWVQNYLCLLCPIADILIDSKARLLPLAYV